MIGREISHYRITGLVSEGGLGIVYKAEDLTLHRTVAVKVVKPTHTDPEAASRRFLREAQVVSQIEHPNVITIYEVVSDGDKNYIVMPHVQGVSLRQRLRGGPFAPREAIDIAVQVASGLEAAHKLAVVHRDIKPENVMIDASGLCKILDFGVAHLVDRSTLTGKGRIVGTLPYMSPEQVQGGQVDHRSDIYSLGILLYEMLTGQLPYEHMEAPALFYQILNVDPPPLAHSNPASPPELQAIISKATAKKVTDRYSTVSEMRHDLKVVQLRMSTEDPSERMYARTRRRWKLALVGLTLLAIGAVAVWKSPWRLADTGRREKPRIMVTRAANSFVSKDLDYLSGAIMDGLIGTLSGLDGYQVLARPTVSSATRSINFETAGLGSPELFDVARRVGADYVVTGSYAPSAGKAVLMRCQLSSVDDGVVLDGWSGEIANLETDFFPTVERFGSNIAEALGAHWKRGAQTGGTAAKSSLPESMPALRAYQRGLSYYEAGNGPAAIEQLKEAVRADSVFPAAYLYLSMLEPEESASARYLALAMKYRRQAAPPVDDLIIALYQTRNDRIDEAIRTYEKILTADPEQVLARQSLAQLLIRKRNFDAALAELRVLEATNPLDYSFYPDWWMALCETSRDEEALRLLTRWRVQCPKEEAPIRQLIGHHMLLGGYDAIPALCDTLETIHEGAALSSRATWCQIVGRMHESEGICRRLLDSPDPYYARSRGLTYLANLHYKAGDYARGLEAIREAHRAQPDFYNAWIAGLLTAAVGDTAAALGYAVEIRRYFTNDADSTVVEGLAYRRFYYNLLGEIALARGDGARAVSMHKAVLRFSTRLDDPFFRTYLGHAYFARGDYTRARKELERVLAVNPSYPDALLDLGECYLTEGEPAKATTVLQRLQDLWKNADPDYRLNVKLNRLLARASRR
jgi:tetratricopeptide (TPR) repeat protein/tRNA A-37 threonylcarbamoyl transferase component Bud32/TolB-like protein